jgi:S1-C subfamily serine protease
MTDEDRSDVPPISPDPDSLSFPPEPQAVPPVGAYAPVSGATANGSRAGTTIAIAVLLSFVIATCSGLAAGFLGARIAGGFGPGGRTTQKVEIIEPKTSEPIVAAAAAGLPSVVNIDVSGGLSSPGSGDLPQDHPSVPTQGNGSGVAYKRAANGGTYIITNSHVVENADTLVVRDSTGASMKAELIGRDAESDIAVVKVDGEIPVIAASDSAKLQVGQAVVAIGSPFGLDHSVTSGVISALGRSLPDFAGAASSVYPLIDVIQTDAAINPGNSGGALVDRTGKLVGINTAIYSDSGASGGIGFAVPANTAVRVADQLVEGGSVTHPFLGVVGQTVTPEFAQEQKLSVTEGTWVADLVQGTGAQKAGVRKGDVITAVDGVPIRSIDDLILNVRRKQVGDTVKLSVLRGEEKLVVDAVVGDKPADPMGQSTPGTSTPDTRTPDKE